MRGDPVAYRLVLFVVIDVAMLQYVTAFSAFCSTMLVVICHVQLPKFVIEGLALDQERMMLLTQVSHLHLLCNELHSTS